MIRAVTGLMGLGMCLLSAPAMANLSLVNYNGFEIRQSGNTWSFSHEPPSSTVLRGGTVLPNAAVSSSQRALVVAKTIPVGKGLPVDVVAKIPAASFARAVVSYGKVVTPIGAAVTAIELLNYFKDIDLDGLKHTANGFTGNGKSEGGGMVSDGFQYQIFDWFPWRDTPQLACNDVAESSSTAQGLPGLYRGVVENGVCYLYVGTKKSNDVYIPPIRVRANESCPAGWFIKDGECKRDSFEGGPEKSEQQILDDIALKSGWPTSAAILAQKMLNEGIPIETETPEVSGPSSVPGEKTVTKESVSLNPGTNTPSAPGSPNSDPGTKTTTKTETTKADYSGPNVKTSTTTTTVTNITNNITNITTTETTEETKEDDEKQEDPPVDTPLGDIPELYKKKYPEGISGVLNSKIAELKATPLFNLPSLLMPSLPNSGSCPSWQIDLRLAGWADMGSHIVEAPCMVWDFGKVVILISALLLARRLIFGG